MHKQLGAAGIAGMALLLVPPAFGAGERVGVAAAVNQDASRTPPGASARTVILGDNLIFRERIETRGDGLVQILLVDGSTFTVGANSDLVIDEFVYDPDAGTGRLVASFGKGVARFVGGKLSKNPGGVTVKTPVGTIGIRGGIANLNVQGEESRFSLLFGDELSFIGKNGKQSRIYERGYTLSVAAALSGGLERPVVRRTTQADIGGVQRGLSGSPGQSGGAPTPPTDQKVSRSPVARANSGRPTTNVAPRPKPQVVRSTNINESGHVTNVINRGANNDIVRRTDTPVDGSTVRVRVLSAGTSYTPASETFSVTDPGAQGLLGGSTVADREVVFTVGEEGTQITGTVDGETLAIPLPSGDEAAFRVVTSGDRVVVGTVHRSGDHFVAFTYFEEISASLLSAFEGGSTPVLATGQPVFGFWGTRTDPAAVRANNDAQVRRYRLSADPVHTARLGAGHDLYFLNPLAADALGSAFLANVRTSDLLLVAGDDLIADDPRFLVASMNIEGSGMSQSSAISLSVGRIHEDETSGFVVGGPRRGGYRASADGPSVSFAGPVSSVAAADGSHVFGPDAETFVLGYGLDTRDVGHDVSAVPPSPYDSPGEQVAGYLHVAQLQSVTPISEYSRTSRVLNGFASGMVEAGSHGGAATPFWSVTPDALVMVFDATSNSIGAGMSVADVLGRDPHLAGLVLGFGDSLFTTGPSGQSALIDDGTYALTHNFGETFAITDAEEVLVPDSNPRSFMVPSTLVGGADDALFTDVARCTCAFLEWGYWGTRFSGEDTTATGPGAQRNDIVHLGTWAAGDVSTFGELPMTGSASYSGHAVGNVARSTEGGQAQYLAAGNFNMTYNFGSRVGSASITGFDGVNVGGTIAGPAGLATSLNHFGGAIAEVEGDISATLTGAFVRGPAGPAQGVVGSFGLSNPTGTYTATGVVVGQQ